MSTKQTANVSVTNNTGGTATILLSHTFATNTPDQGQWIAAPGQTVGPMQVTFYTGDPGLDFWFISAIVNNGTNIITYQSEGTAAYPEKECMMDSDDAGQNLTFAVDTGTFSINLASGGCTTSMSEVSTVPSFPIQNVFVLMLENRSFDHMLGFSGITGTDAVTGEPTAINGLKGTESNSFQGVTYTVQQPADLSMPVDPAHEFQDVAQQLCGEGWLYPSGAAYPKINNSGFVADYVNSTSVAQSSDEGDATSNYGEIMKCYSPSQLPVLNYLATQFCVCDNWFSSLPGPTWPNRFFAHAASSGGLDHSPSDGDMAKWDSYSGFTFPNGTIFDALKNKGLTYRLYQGQGLPCPPEGAIPIVAALHNISYLDTISFDQFASDVAELSYNYNYTFIEPNYGNVFNNSYSGGTSQHPMDNVLNGEQLIWDTYNAIRNSPHWEKSLLIITYDEHGGFYDHVAPPAAVAPGDGASTQYNQNGFTFEQLGVRVPAIVISPFIKQNTIDHRVYDHSSIPATIEALFGLSPLTKRDAAANNLKPLVNSAFPQQNNSITAMTPEMTTVLQNKMQPAINAPSALANTTIGVIEPNNKAVTNTAASAIKLANPEAAVPASGNLQGMLQIMLKTQLETAPFIEREAIIANFKNIKTQAQALAYIQTVTNATKTASKVV